MSLPIVQELTALPSHTSRADWLMRCPDWHFMGYVASIRKVFEDMPFPEAIPFLNARHASLLATRTAEGRLPQTVLMAVHHSMLEMVHAAKTRDGGEG
jgi:hypothetical protein